MDGEQQQKREKKIRFLIKVERSPGLRGYAYCVCCPQENVITMCNAMI